MLVNLKDQTPCNPTGRSDLPNGLCWPDRENTELRTEGAQKCPDKQKLDPSLFLELLHLQPSYAGFPLLMNQFCVCEIVSIALPLEGLCKEGTV